MTTISSEQALDFSNKSKRMRLEADQSTVSPSHHQTVMASCLNSPPQQPSSTTHHLPNTPPMNSSSLFGLSSLLAPSMLSSSLNPLGHSDGQSAFSSMMPPSNTNTPNLSTQLQLQQLLIGLSQQMNNNNNIPTSVPAMASMVPNSATAGLLAPSNSLLTAVVPPTIAVDANLAAPDMPSAATDPTITAQALQSMQRRRKRAAQLSEKQQRQQQTSSSLSMLATSTIPAVSEDSLCSPSKPASEADTMRSCESTPSKHNDEDGVVKDAAYWERRRKNNSAAKRSRDQRRLKEEQVAQRAAFLEQENLKLRAQVNVLKNETAKLQFLLFNNPLGTTTQVKRSPTGSTAESANSGNADTLSPVLTD